MGEGKRTLPPNREGLELIQFQALGSGSGGGIRTQDGVLDREQAAGRTTVRKIVLVK